MRREVVRREVVRREVMREVLRRVVAGGTVWRKLVWSELVVREVGRLTCVFDMQMGSEEKLGSFSYCATRRSASSVYLTPLPPYTCSPRQPSLPDGGGGGRERGRGKERREPGHEGRRGEELCSSWRGESR